MTPVAARAMYKRQFADTEIVTLRRLGTPNIDVKVHAKFVSFTPEELVNGIDQTLQKVLVLAEDVETSGFPSRIEEGDRLIVGDDKFKVEASDDRKRRVAGVLMAYELQVRG